MTERGWSEFERGVADRMGAAVVGVTGALEAEAVRRAAVRQLRRSRRRAVVGTAIGIAFLAGIGTAAMPGSDGASTVVTADGSGSGASTTIPGSVLGAERCGAIPLDGEVSGDFVVGVFVLDEDQSRLLGVRDWAVPDASMLLTGQQVRAVVAYERALAQEDAGQRAKREAAVGDGTPWPLTLAQMQELDGAGLGLDGRQLFWGGYANPETCVDASPGASTTTTP